MKEKAEKIKFLSLQLKLLKELQEQFKQKKFIALERNFDYVIKRIEMRIERLGKK